MHGSQPLFTPVIAEQAWDEGQAHPFDESRAAARSNPLTLVGSQLWGEAPEITTRAALRAGAQVILTPRLGSGGVEDTQTRNDSLTMMRLVLAGQVDVQVAVGGKLHRDTGFNPGVLEELAIMRWNGIRCFIVAGFGGMAGELEATMLRQFSEGNLLAWDEVDKMAKWSESGDEYVGTLLTHFARYRDSLLVSFTPARGRPALR